MCSADTELRCVLFLDRRSRSLSIIVIFFPDVLSFFGTLPLIDPFVPPLCPCFLDFLEILSLRTSCFSRAMNDHDQALLQELREIKMILHDLHDHLADFLVVEDEALEKLFEGKESSSFLFARFLTLPDSYA